MGEPAKKVTYDAEAVNFVSEIWDEFYDEWLSTATANAISNGRSKVEVDDFKEVIKDVLERFLKEKEFKAGETPGQSRQ